jgi:hypothetical protein
MPTRRSFPLNLHTLSAPRCAAFYRCRERPSVPVALVRSFLTQAEVEPTAYRVLPLRLGTTTIEALDEVWRRRGIASRSEFLRGAVAAQLTAMGEDAAASALRSSNEVHRCGAERPRRRITTAGRIPGAVRDALDA